MKLEKKLGFTDVFSLAAGAMISSGIFILPGFAFTLVGPAVFVSYFLAGVVALIGVLSVIELSTAMPKAGGDYYFITRSLGPFIGTVSGFLSWFALSLKSAFAVFGMVEVVYGFPFMQSCGVPPIAAMLGLVAVFAAVNIIGTKEAAKLEVLLVVLLLVLMLSYIFMGISHVQIARFSPFVHDRGNFGKIISTAGFVFISFGGLLKVASVSEEVKDPKKILPKAMISSVIAVTALYSLMLIVTVGILPADTLKNGTTPIATAAAGFAGSFGFWAITIAALLAFITTANAGILAASRYPVALSRDGLMPKIFDRPKPYFAILLTAAVMGISLFLKLETLVKAASTVILVSYVLSNLAVIILRESKIVNYRPSFKTPFYPWLQVVSIVIFTFLIVDMGLKAVEASIIFVGISVLMYLLYGRRHKRDYALLHLINRISNRDLFKGDIEEEFKGVLYERDEIVKDDFDTYLEAAAIYDLHENLNLDDFFNLVSAEIAPMIKIEPDIFKDLLLKRELDYGTVISDNTAVPHILVEGEGVFNIFVFRNLAGVKFSGEAEKITAIFIIVGSRDMRNKHLRALAALAQIIQNKNFASLWNNARTTEQVRDILLLGTRHRKVQ